VAVAEADGAQVVAGVAAALAAAAVVVVVLAEVLVVAVILVAEVREAVGDTDLTDLLIRFSRIR
jgi:hypothetical protein